MLVLKTQKFKASCTLERRLCMATLYATKTANMKKGITGCAVNGDWLCRREMAIFDPPQNTHPLTDH